MVERKSHIVRIKGENRSGETVDGMNLDIRRTDVLPMQDTGDGQSRYLEVAWDDEYTGDPPEDEDRIERIIKLTDPENPPDDPDDPEEFFSVPVLDQFSVYDADQKIIVSFANKRVEDEGDETAREVRLKRITYAETDPAELEQPIDAADYVRVPDTEDKDQYIDQEVIETLPHVDSGQEYRHEFGIDDDDLMKSFSAPPENAENKPVRLDPMQSIVNVQWQKRLQIVFSWKSGGVDNDAPVTMYYQTLFGEPVRSGSVSAGTINDPIIPTVPDFDHEGPAFSLTDAQIATAESLGASPISAGGLAYAATVDALYAIKRNGGIKWSVDISGQVGRIPDNFNTDPAHNNFGTEANPETTELVRFQLVAVNGAAFVGFERLGFTQQVGEGLAVGITLLVVGYVGFDKDGSLIASELIDGPDISTSYTDVADVEHFFNSASGMDIQTGKFSSS